MLIEGVLGCSSSSTTTVSPKVTAAEVSVRPPNFQLQVCHVIQSSLLPSYDATCSCIPRELSLARIQC
jgi:hypothetical protein